ncbi:putative inorganic phosphate cotransporter isoform X1 [Ixodes scapularis]|uniref:putative inorganic phosphate cotransporter isoform X1 n=1 Tax=Ixodes scapularis TaxID=6945 RepID=UPI001A9D61F2|nr:putative inorganic phosphate cotransporter isoform X1 [Ixodes scapularis]
MLAQWVPKAQRTVISSMVFTGSFTGTVIAMTATGVMSDSEFLGGWQSAFYVFGFSGCVWCIVWFTYIQNKPTEHPDSPGFSASKLSGGNVIPWCAILTSPAVWSLTATQWAHTYGSYTLMTELPNYLKNILGFGLTQNGLLSGVPYLMLSVFSLLVGWAADLVRRRNIATATTIRKFCDSVSAFGPALCLMAVTATPCERTLAVFWFWLAIALISFANSGFNCTHVDMAPAFAEQRGQLEARLLHNGHRLHTRRRSVYSIRLGRTSGVGQPSPHAEGRRYVFFLHCVGTSNGVARHRDGMSDGIVLHRVGIFYVVDDERAHLRGLTKLFGTIFIKASAVDVRRYEGKMRTLLICVPHIGCTSGVARGEFYKVSTPPPPQHTHTLPSLPHGIQRTL